MTEQIYHHAHKSIHVFSAVHQMRDKVELRTSSVSYNVLGKMFIGAGVANITTSSFTTSSWGYFRPLIWIHCTPEFA